MTRINLLPWREKYIEIQNRRFGFFCVVAVMLSFIMCLMFKFMIILYTAGIVNDRHYLQNELAMSENKTQEASSLLITKDSLLKRIKIIEKLQVRRNLGIEILDGIATALPTKITLVELSCRGDMVKITGIASDNENVSNYLKAIEKNLWVAEAVLSEIKNNAQLGMHPASVVAQISGDVKFIIDVKMKVLL